MPNLKKKGTNKIAGEEAEEVDPKAFHNQTGRIEIVREGQVERVYYRIPELCKRHTKGSREHFVRKVNRDDGPQGKIDALVTETEFFMREMEYQESLQSRYGFFSYLRKKWRNFKLLGFLLSILVNLLVVAGFESVTALWF